MDATEFQREVGHRMRRKRQMLGLSQREVARRLAMPQSQLSRLEKGDFKHVDLWQLRQLMNVLQTSAGFVLGEHEDPGPVPLPGCPGKEQCLSSATPSLVARLPEETDHGECITFPY